MLSKNNLKASGSGLAVLAAMALAGTPAMAQDLPDSGGDSAVPSEPQSDPDVVVTGTLIRGVAPTGTNVIGKNREEILTSGASYAADV